MSEEVVGTEEVVVASEVTTSGEAGETTESSRRGRPRPDDVVARDNKVFEIVKNGAAPMTRKQVAEAAGEKESHVYLSLLRLRHAGKLQLKRTSDGHFWSLVSDTVDAAAAAAETVDEVIDESTVVE